MPQEPAGKRSLCRIGAIPPLAAVRATLLGRLGRHDEARTEFERAAVLTGNASEHRLYRRQADALGHPDRGPASN